ncbi:MAG: ParB N-terminal domain-containing protein [Firmicutes bacterium]|nr:ParB N-terminal domain-containing protein [Bacillota bacterium]
MELNTKRIDEIIPYPHNPRVNDQAVDAVAESIRQCGYIAPIIVDEEGVILAGHTRYKALKKIEAKDRRGGSQSRSDGGAKAEIPAAG